MIILRIIKKNYPSDWKELFIAISIVFAISLFINPLKNIEISVWDRTFSTALLDNISFSKRVFNLYSFILFIVPSVFLIVATGIGAYLKKFYYQKDNIFLLSFFLFLLTLSAYFHSVKDILLIGILVIIANVIIFSYFDNKRIITFSFITQNLVMLLTLTVLSNILFKFRHIYPSFIFSVLFFELFLASCFFVKKGNNYIKIFPYVLMWLPSICFITQEVIFFLTEKGYLIQNDRTCILTISILYLIISSYILVKTNKSQSSAKVFGYIGLISSFVFTAYFLHNYQIEFNYHNYSNIYLEKYAHIYELGNNTVAADSFYYGKLPIIDYFSAHALYDVWTQLVYSFIYNDYKGILVNPYSGLNQLISFFILFYIIKSIFSVNKNNQNIDLVILYLVLFPSLITGIKWVSICSISVAGLIYSNNKKSYKADCIFWITVLIASTHLYDEGISLSLGCIASIIIKDIICKSWLELKRFIIAGITIGVIVFLFYIFYCLYTGIAPFLRIKEWISVSISSGGTWATSNIGQDRPFEFFVAYIISPLIITVVCIKTIYNQCKSKQYSLLALLVIAYSVGQILYIPRTLMLHNLAVTNGITGVLLNYIHWTLALFALYYFSKYITIKHKNLIFIFVMFITITLEGIFVTKQLPSSHSTLTGKAIEKAKNWSISNNITSNYGKPRIYFETNTQNLVNKFKIVFDSLLTEKQSFLDFANITSMYLLTERRRPVYVSQSPSLLANLFSQDMFLKQIKENDCPIAVIGTTNTDYLQQMVYIPHNIRYYRIAEYIYSNYRPIITFDEIAIWCKKDLYNSYLKKIQNNKLLDKGFSIIDYGYDFTYYSQNNNELIFTPFHEFNLKYLPYIWANKDKYYSNKGKVLAILSKINNKYIIPNIEINNKQKGNYLAFKIKSDKSCVTKVTLYNSENIGTTYQYQFNVQKGEYDYLIRISQDYFWYAFNIDTVEFFKDENMKISNSRILEGD